MGRDTESKGKLAELKVIGELVKEGFIEIYTPIIDVGVDIIVKRDDGGYSEIQVKSRSRDEDSFSVQNLNLRKTLVVVLHVLNTDNFWVIPSEEFKNLARKTGDAYVLNMSAENQKLIRKYRNDWDVIKNPFITETASEKEQFINRTTSRQKAPKVRLQELIKLGLLKDGQTLYFHHTTGNFDDEEAQIIANKLKYKSDGKIYSISYLAQKILEAHGFTKQKHGVAGPKYWKTKEGKLLNELNEQVRKQQGDRNR